MILRIGVRLLSFLAALLLAGPSGVRAGTAEAPAQQDYQVRVWAANDGLSVNSITDVAQTPEGYLWAGTLLSGLLRFDGVAFTQFSPRNTPAFPGIGVRRLMVDRAGLLWISTYDGDLATWDPNGFTLIARNLARLDALLYSREGHLLFDSDGGLLIEGRHDGKAWQWKTHRVSELTRARAQLCADKAGRVWCVRGGQELGVWEAGTLKKLGPAPGLEGQTISALAADAAGDIWVGTDKGLMKWEEGRFVNQTLPDSRPPEPVRSITPSGDSLWVQGPERLRRIAGGKWAAEAKGWPAGYAMRNLNFRRGDATGAFWASNEEIGLIHVGPDGTIKTVSTSDGLPSNSMRTVFPDRVGNIWIGYERGGLAQLRPRYFETIGRAQGLSNTVVNSVCEDAEGALWIGAAGRSIFQFKEGKCFEHALPPEVKGRETVVTVDAENRIWAGCWSGGLLRLIDGKFVQVIPQQNLQGDIRLMLPARDGRLWLGMLYSISIVEDGKARVVYSTKDPAFSPAAIAEGTDGTIWLGTFDRGLMRWDGSEFVGEPTPGNRFKGRFWSILPTPDGGLWVGTTESGLLRWKNGKFLQVGKSQGLYSNFVTQVQMDLAGNLWLITGAGLEKIPAEALVRFERGEIQTLPVSRFSRFEGINEGGGSFEFQPNCWRGRTGNLWFATGNSVTGIAPGGVRPNASRPTVVIEEMIVDQKKVWPASPGKVISVAPDSPPRPQPPGRPLVTIPPGQHDVQFSFSALDCRAPQVVTFKYRLQGFEDEWREIRGARRVSYNSLPPGNYTFQLMASNNDAQWNENCASFAFELLPYFYQTAWFYWLVGICAVTVPAAAVWFGVRRRMRRRLEVERDRARIAQDMHDEIGAKLTRISHLSEQAKHPAGGQGPADAQMDAIAKMSRDLVQSLDEIVWAVDPKQDTLESLVDYLGEYSVQIFSDSGIRCRLDFPDHVPDNSPPEVRHQVFLAFKEALNNVAKHSRAREVQIKVVVGSDSCSIVVRDDGVGMDRSALKEDRRIGGHGLNNMAARMAAIGGRCDVESMPGKGTVICLSWKKS